jgi:hypothetical protein
MGGPPPPPPSGSNPRAARQYGPTVPILKHLNAAGKAEAARLRRSRGAPGRVPSQRPAAPGPPGPPGIRWTTDAGAVGPAVEAARSAQSLHSRSHPSHFCHSPSESFLPLAVRVISATRRPGHFCHRQPSPLSFAHREPGPRRLPPHAAVGSVAAVRPGPCARTAGRAGPGRAGPTRSERAPHEAGCRAKEGACAGHGAVRHTPPPLGRPSLPPPGVWTDTGSGAPGRVERVRDQARLKPAIRPAPKAAPPAPTFWRLL